MDVGAKKPYVKNAADQEQVKSAARKSRWAREDDVNDVRELLKTPQGRRFMWRYLGFCKVFETSFTGNSQTFFNEGQRNVGLTMLNDINDADPEALILMMRDERSKLALEGEEKNG